MLKLTMIALVLGFVVGCTERRTNYEYLDQFRDICESNGGVHYLRIYQTEHRTEVTNVKCKDGAEFDRSALESKIKDQVKPVPEGGF